MPAILALSCRNRYPENISETNLPVFGKAAPSIQTYLMYKISLQLIVFAASIRHLGLSLTSQLSLQLSELLRKSGLLNSREGKHDRLDSKEGDTSTFRSSRYCRKEAGWISQCRTCYFSDFFSVNNCIKVALLICCSKIKWRSIALYRLTICPDLVYRQIWTTSNYHLKS